MSRLPTHLPPPSYHGFMYRLPATELIHQHRPVYYASGIRPAHFRDIQLAHRNRIAAARASLQAQRSAAVEAKQAALQQFAGNTGSGSRQQQQAVLDAAVRLAATGLVSEASPLFLSLHRGNGGGAAASAPLAPIDYCRYISALGAPAVFDALLTGEANFDKSVAFKMMGDIAGNGRAQEALAAFEMAADAMAAASASSGKNGSGSGVNRIVFFNALMQTLLSCGYDNVKRVSGDVYDSIGAAKLNPTAATYKAVMLALCLQANPDEASDILTFLRTNGNSSNKATSSSSSSPVVDTAMYNNLMLGYREARLFDRVDQLWAELVDRRVPMPNVESAEEMIRSVVELANTPLTDPALQFRSQLNVVEKKRVPVILNQMEQLGIMRCCLCPPVLHEVEACLRQFSIYRSRFYEWGRAVKILDFVEYRRKHGWLYDMQDMALPLTHAPTLRPYNADPLLGIAPFAKEALPSHLSERPSWERQPLAALFSKITTDERMEDSRNGNDKYDVNHTSVHARDASWRSKVPQTRYDALYGVTSPSMPTVGVRRHLAGTESAALGTNEYQVQRDNSIVRRSLAKARRTRQHVDRARTHRSAANIE